MRPPGRGRGIALKSSFVTESAMRAAARNLVLALAAGGLLAACQKPVAAPATDAEMSLGNPAAKVTVVEYASDTCPHCARFGEEVFPAFKAKYVDTGKVRYVFREFLTPPVNVAAAGFLLARCSGKDNYFKVVDAEFRAQERIYESGDVHGVLGEIGKSVGLSQAQVDACIQDPNALAALQARVDKAADQDHVTGTPTILVNGKVLAVGEITLAQLDAAIQPLLAN
jgi:protein-disulfide isomerase